MLKNDLELSRVGKGCYTGRLRLALRASQQLPNLARLFFAALLIVILNPVVPALRADAANLLKETFDFVVLLPEPRKALPVVYVHSCEQIGYFHHACGAAMRQHGRQRFGALEVFCDAMRLPCTAMRGRLRTVSRGRLAVLPILAPE